MTPGSGDQIGQLTPALCGEGAWRVGAATVALPVAPGTPLDGYVARTGVASGLHDPLAVGALLVERDGARLAIVTADVVGVDRGLVDQVIATAGLDEAVALVCASHTHSGPAGLVARLHPAQSQRADPVLRAAFVAACGEAVAAARARLAPATLWIGQAPARGVAANRNDPAAPSDDTLTVIAARGDDGAARAWLVHFACHPTVLGADNLLVSADLPGALRRALEAGSVGAEPAPVVLFVNGAAGDVSTRFTRRGQGFAEVARLGRVLAAAAREAIASARPIAGRMRAVAGSATLELAKHGEESALDPDVKDAGDSERMPASDAPAVRRREAVRTEGAALAAAGGELTTETTIRLDAVALGDLGLVAVPGELLAGLGRRIVAASPFATTLVLGYANGYAGYLADADAHAARTYEALASPFSPSAGPAVVDLATTLLDRLAR